MPWCKTLCGYWYQDILQKVGSSHLKFNFKKVSINIDKLLSMTGFKHILCFDWSEDFTSIHFKIHHTDHCCRLFLSIPFLRVVRGIEIIITIIVTLPRFMIPSVKTEYLFSASSFPSFMFIICFEIRRFAL